MQWIKAAPGERICIGYEGEHLARQVRFDLSEWIALYGEGTAELIYQRPKEETPYPVAIEREGNEVFWTVTATDVARAGMFGRAELRYYVGEALVKSEHCYVTVLDAIGVPGDVPPKPGQSWLDQALSAGAEAKQSADRAEAAAVRQPVIGENGNWWVWDTETGVYVDSGNRAEGPQGDTPVKGVDYWTDADRKELASEAADQVKETLCWDDLAQKPFGDVIAAELLPETKVSTEENMGLVEADFLLEAGETYLVVWDGAEYEFTAGSFTDEEGIVMVSLGNDEINLEQFGAGSIDVHTRQTDGTHTLALSHLAVKTLDLKYLPEIVATEEDLKGLASEQYVEDAIAGVEVVQSNWKQSDKTQADYVKNRPFYYGYQNVLDETVIYSTENTMEGSAADIPDIYGLVIEGVEYMVVIDGMPYRVAAGREFEVYWLDGDFGYVHIGADRCEIYGLDVGEHTIEILSADEGFVIEKDYLDAFKAALPTVELTATLEDGTTQTYKLYGEAVTE